jgi:hypothetical protein
VASEGPRLGIQRKMDLRLVWSDASNALAPLKSFACGVET